MSDAPAREWRFYITDMIGFAENVISYTNGFEPEHFVGSGITYDATLRNLELIGEAATHIPQNIREQYADVTWRLLICHSKQANTWLLGH